MVWTACVNGHDLTAPNAYIYGPLAMRYCRACVTERGSMPNGDTAKRRAVKPRRKESPRVDGAFQ